MERVLKVTPGWLLTVDRAELVVLMRSRKPWLKLHAVADNVY